MTEKVRDLTQEEFNQVVITFLELTDQEEMTEFIVEAYNYHLRSSGHTGFGRWPMMTASFDREKHIHWFGLVIDLENPPEKLKQIRAELLKKFPAATIFIIDGDQAYEKTMPKV